MPTSSAGALSLNSLLRRVTPPRDSSLQRSESSMARVVSPTTRNRAGSPAAAAAQHRPLSPTSRRSIGGGGPSSQVLLRDEQATRILIVHDTVWVVGPDRVGTYDANGAATHRLVLPAGSSPFTGAAAKVNDTVWLGHQNGSIRIVHRDGRGQLGPSIRKHHTAVVDVAHCRVTNRVATTDTSCLIFVWHGLESTPQVGASFSGASGGGGGAPHHRLRILGAPTGAFLFWDARRLVTVTASVADDDAASAQCAATDHGEVVSLLEHDIGCAVVVDTSSEVWLGSGARLVLLSVVPPQVEMLSRISVPVSSPIELLTACGATVLVGSKAKCLVMDASTRVLLRDISPWTPCTQLLPTACVTSWRLVAFGDGVCTNVTVDAARHDAVSARAASIDPPSPAHVPQHVEDVRAAQRAHDMRQSYVGTLAALRAALTEAAVNCEAAAAESRSPTILATLTAIDRAYSIVFDAASHLLEPSEVRAWSASGRPEGSAVHRSDSALA